MSSQFILKMGPPPIMVGVGDYKVSNGENRIIKTMALGSCVGVTFYSARLKIAGLLHVALPDSRIDPDQAEGRPGYFADTGVQAVVSILKRKGVRSGGELTVKLAGGANVLDPGKFFDIGKKNILGIKRQLYKYSISIEQEDTGGEFSRTMWIEIGSGRTFLSSPGKGAWEL